MSELPDALPPIGSPEHWLLHARSDLHAGIVLRADDAVLNEQACFHFQQAAEKALKGVLVARRLDFPRTHDLRQLLDILIASGMRVPRAVQRAEVLTPYAVQTRYPTEMPAISDDELDEAQTAAAATVAWAETRVTSTRETTRSGRGT